MPTTEYGALEILTILEANGRGDQTLRNTDSRSSFPDLPNGKNHLGNLSKYRLLGLPLIYPFEPVKTALEILMVSKLPGAFWKLCSKKQAGKERKRV